jgi:hypothetical protein
MLIGEVMLIARCYCKLVNAWDLSAYAYLVRYAYLQYPLNKVKFISSRCSISYNALFYSYYLGVLC